MDGHKSRLEVTTLTWDYSEYCGDAINFRYENKAKPGKQQWVLLPEHKCPYPNECGLYLAGVEIAVGNDGCGISNILHPGCTRSGASDHEFKVLARYLRDAFVDDVIIKAIE